MGEIREEQKVKLSFKTYSGTQVELSCVIRDVEKDRLTLSFPKDALSYIEYLQEGNEIPVQIYTPSGIRMFDAVILNSPIDKNFVIEYVEDSIQIQRREYSRVTLETKIIIERTSGENIVTKTMDIGGGGVRFIYSGFFAQNEFAKCRLYLPMHLASVQAEGIIAKKPHLGSNEYVFQFEKISESDRDKILQKCFEIEASFYKEA